MLPVLFSFTTFLLLPSSILAAPTTVPHSPDANPDETITDNFGQCQHTQNCLELTGDNIQSNTFFEDNTYNFEDPANFLNLTGHIDDKTSIFVGYCACTFYALWEGDADTGTGASSQAHLEHCHVTNTSLLIDVPYYATCTLPDVNRHITSIKGNPNQAQPISNL